ncbi:MAG: response regulator transcription factor [Dehalococcoidales bacterium]|nr:response regulator transcription factor [Dehalococcoidales bacterium]
MITIVLADDHKIVRQGVRALLEGESDLKVIGEAANGKQALEMVESLHPDVLVTDLLMDGTNGIRATRQVKKRFPETTVIVLSMYANVAYVAEAVRAGANGYVLKGSDLTDLTRAIREARGGSLFLSTPLSKEAVNDYIQKTKGSSAANPANGERS